MTQKRSEDKTSDSSSHAVSYKEQEKMLCEHNLKKNQTRVAYACSEQKILMTVLWKWFKRKGKED